MPVRGKSGEHANEEGIYICDDGCERRFYHEGDEFHTCALHGGETTWVKVDEI